MGEPSYGIARWTRNRTAPALNELATTRIVNARRQSQAPCLTLNAPECDPTSIWGRAFDDDAGEQPIAARVGVAFSTDQKEPSSDQRDSTCSLTKSTSAG